MWSSDIIPTSAECIKSSSCLTHNKRELRTRDNTVGSTQHKPRFNFYQEPKCTAYKNNIIFIMGSSGIWTTSAECIKSHTRLTHNIRHLYPSEIINGPTQKYTKNDSIHIRSLYMQQIKAREIVYSTGLGLG